MLFIFCIFYIYHFEDATFSFSDCGAKKKLPAQRLKNIPDQHDSDQKGQEI
jgi:hypothetical protein